MRRTLASLALAAGLSLTAPFAAAAAPPVPDTAIVSIDNADPAYGDTVILTATVDSDERTQMRTICTHDFGQSYGHSIITDAETYTDDVGLYAPNWPSGGATCTANVILFDRNGPEWKKVIGSLTFAVDP